MTLFDNIIALPMEEIHKVVCDEYDELIAVITEYLAEVKKNQFRDYGTERELVKVKRKRERLDRLFSIHAGNPPVLVSKEQRNERFAEMLRNKTVEPYDTEQVREISPELLEQLTNGCILAMWINVNFGPDRFSKRALKQIAKGYKQKVRGICNKIDFLRAARHAKLGIDDTQSEHELEDYGNWELPIAAFA